MYWSEFNSFYLNSISLFTEAEAQSLNPQVVLGPPGQHSGSHFREKPWTGPGLHGGTILGHLGLNNLAQNDFREDVHFHQGATSEKEWARQEEDRKQCAVPDQLVLCQPSFPVLPWDGTVVDHETVGLLLFSSSWVVIVRRAPLWLTPITHRQFVKTHTAKHCHVH